MPGPFLILKIKVLLLYFSWATAHFIIVSALTYSSVLGDLEKLETLLVTESKGL